VLLGAGDGSLGAPSFYAIRDTTTALALGDVSGDGKLDIVTARSPGGSDKGTVSVLLGTGGGQFAARVDYDVGRNPRGVALGDVNGDHLLDIVVANAGLDSGWSTGVLLGKGNGTFAVEAEYPADCGPIALALGDLNGDGKLDVVQIGGICSMATVLLGQGDGKFPKLVEYNVGEISMSSVALADVNGDGALDIVMANSRLNGVTVLYGKGDGTFPSSAGYAVNASSAALGDLNGDGRPDLVTVSGGDVNVLLGTCQ